MSRCQIESVDRSVRSELSAGLLVFDLPIGPVTTKLCRVAI